MNTLNSYVLRVGTLILVAGFAAAAFAKPPDPAKKAGPVYDPDTEVMFAGMVTDTMVEANDAMIVVNTAIGPVVVLLGPAKMIRRLELVLEPADEVEITGSKVRIGDQTVVIAREVVTARTTFILRDARGAPVWKKVLPTGPGA